jgi:hypothetical protein
LIIRRMVHEERPFFNMHYKVRSSVRYVHWLSVSLQ